ncbi:MAG: STAS domain-containing protein [Lysobacteraceae bacterium]
MSTSEDTLRLSGALDAAGAAAAWPQLAARARHAARIDLSEVTGIDSSGVALVRCLRELVRAATGTAPPVVGMPARYAQICLAHRLDAGGDLPA